jgi:hypothetical protein
MAIKGNWSIPVKRFWGIKAIGSGPPAMEIMVAHPMVAKTGIPIAIQITNVSISVTELFSGKK